MVVARSKGAILTEREGVLLLYVGIARYATAEQVHRLLFEGRSKEADVPAPREALCARRRPGGGCLLLGHSDPKITERRYGHLLPEFMSAAANRLQFGLGGLLEIGKDFRCASLAASYTWVTVRPGAKRRGRNPSGFP
jgi:hypothetical protein